MSEKFIISVHAERDELKGEIDVDTSFEGSNTELAQIMCEVLRDDVRLRAIMSSAFYLLDDEHVQVEEEIEDLVELFKYDGTRH